MSPDLKARLDAIDAEYAEKIDRARVASEDRRDLAFVDAPRSICGLTVRVLTLADYITLCAVGNAHFADVQQPSADLELRRFWCQHHAQLLWLISPDYRANDPKAAKAFAEKKVAPLDFALLLGEVSDYLREVFTDAPRGAKPKDGEPILADPVGVSIFAHWISRISKRYPWSRADIRALPLPELWQYLRIIRAEQKIENGEQPSALDGEVDRLWAEKLEKQTQLLAKS